MREFMEVWRSGEALPGPEVIALVRRFTLGCAGAFLRKIDVRVDELETLRHKALEKYIDTESPDRMRYYSGTPDMWIGGYRLFIKAFDERFQPFERLMFWPSDEAPVGISLRVNLIPVGGERYRVGPVCVGLLWGPTRSVVSGEAYEVVLGEEWSAIRRSPRWIPQEEGGERHFLGLTIAPEDWSQAEEGLTTYVGDLLDRSAKALSRSTGLEGTGLRDAARSLEERLHRKGYRFSSEQIATFYAALKAKGFVILSGLSGTGKTKLAQEFAAAMGLDQHHFLLEPVKPDWRDNSGLLGYWNPVTGQYEATRFLRLLLAAAEEYQSGEPPTAQDSVETYIRRRLGESALQARLQRHRERLREVNQWRGSWTEEQLRILWLDWDNGTGQMRPPGELRVDFGTLRQATDVLVDRSVSVVQRALRVLEIFGDAGVKKPPTGRVIRALAALEPALVPAIGSRAVLKGAAKAWGHRVRLRKGPEPVRWQDREEIWLTLREASTPLLEALGLDPSDGAVRTLVLELANQFSRRGDRTEADADEESGTSDETDGVRPYFVVLDEMNLARVEYYLADILSVLETGRSADGLTRGEITLHSQGAAVATADGLRVPPALRLSPNLYFVGTVNTDETTFAFSPKVLDRAFAMEVREVDLSDYPSEVDESSEEESVDEALLTDFTRQGRFAQLTKADVAAWGRGRSEYVALLDSLNKKVLPYDLGFGYRVVDEVLAFVGALAESPLGAALSEDEAFDAAVMMKVLPKFHGPRNRLERPLQAVLEWAGERFGRTHEKAGQMLERAQMVGHTRFS